MITTEKRIMCKPAMILLHLWHCKFRGIWREICLVTLAARTTLSVGIHVLNTVWAVSATNAPLMC